MNNQQAYEIMQIKATGYDEITKIMETETDPTVVLVRINMVLVDAELEMKKVGD